MVIFSQCMDCKNFIGKLTDDIFYCKAFPKGIPEDVLWNKIDHREHIAGDHGFLFENLYTNVSEKSNSD